MENSHIKLNSPEVAALWTTYIQNTAVRCWYKHFLQHLTDVEIKTILEEVLVLVETHIEQLKTIFNEENIPVPKGFSDKDINLQAPTLFSDEFALAFVYRTGKMFTISYAFNITRLARSDLVNLWEVFLSKETKLYKKALNLMLSKGIFDRAPKMEYPKEVEFIQHQPSLMETWFGEARPLNSMEVGELFFAIERNAIGLITLMAFIQVTQDKEIKEYLLKGKKLAEKQIGIFSKFLQENDDFGGFPMTTEITNSRISPFSDRLILFLISTSNGPGFSDLSYSMSQSMRTDLIVHYSLLIGEIMKYGGEGLKLLIERGWMEKPPQSNDRRKFYKS